MAKALSWDGFITNDGEGFTLLEPGEYEFVVADFERSRTQKTDMPMAVLTLEVGNEIDERTQITDYLVLQDTLEWKISQFFRSLGLKKHGESVHTDKTFEKSVGMSGRCRVVQEEYVNKDGEKRKSNKIKRYLEPERKAKQIEDVDWE